MNSYELSNIILELRAQAEDGLIDAQTFEDTVEALDVESKLNGLIYANKRIKSEIELLKEEEKRIRAEVHKQERNGERIKDLIKMLLAATKANKFDGVAGKISFRKSTSLEIASDFAERHKNEDYVIKDINYKIDKKALKSIIQAYGAIEGAQLIEKNNLQIR